MLKWINTPFMTSCYCWAKMHNEEDSEAEICRVFIKGGEWRCRFFTDPMYRSHSVNKLIEEGWDFAGPIPKPQEESNG